jgi:hypothetical protein
MILDENSIRYGFWNATGALNIYKKIRKAKEKLACWACFGPKEAAHKLAGWACLVMA